jgi:predicted metal-binding protein
MVSAGAIDAHVRLSQCLNCCDGGHTVRLEHKGWEFGFIGIRTEDELQDLLTLADAIVQFPPHADGSTNQPLGQEHTVPAHLVKRIYQVWYDGRLVWHQAT